jgi:cytochrome P450
MTDMIVRDVVATPGRIPFLGHVVQMLTNPREFFNSLRETGPVVTIGLGPVKAYVINDPDLVHQVLTKDVRKLDKGIAYEKSAPFLGDGLLNSTEPTHMVHRRLMQPAFHQQQIAGYADQMREEALARVGGWRNGQRVEMDQEIHAFAVSVVCRALFSSDLARRVADEVENSLPVLLKGVTRRIALPIGWLEKLPTPSNRRFDDARVRLDRTLREVMAEYEARGVRHGDLMAMLLAARAEDGKPGLSPQQVHDEAMALFLGGVETARDVLSWACHLLTQHPEVQRGIAAEVDEVLATGPIDHSAIARLAYTRRVITEALRLYPPAWLLTRRTVVDLELGGRLIPQGSNVLFSVYAIQRDPKVYAQPDAFDPDRWDGEAGAALPRVSYLPFGAGNRGCIGEPFAWEEMIIFLASVLGEFTLHEVPGVAIRPARSPMLQPKQLPIVVRRRIGPESG